MRQLLLCLIAFFLLTVAHGQTTFQKIYGGSNLDYGQSIQQTNDSGFIIAGYTKSFGATWNDAYLIKTASDGSLQWTKTFGGTLDDQAFSIQKTTDGGFVVTGRTYSFGAGNYDVFLTKTASDGTLQWTKTFGGTGDDEGNFVQQTTDGGFIITGETYSFGAGYNDVYLVKTDSSGTLQWGKTFGGTDIEYGRFVQQTTDGGFIITGVSYSFGAGGFDIYLVKTASDGTIQWTKTFGGTGDDEGNAVQQTNDGGFIITGFTTSFGAGIQDVYLLKTASDGSLQWTKTFGGTSTEYGYSVNQTNDGGFILIGITSSFGAGSNDVYLVKTDTDGTLQWTKTFGGAGSEAGNSVQQTNDGGFIITGFTGSFLGAGLYDIYLIKTDSNGTSGCNEINSNIIVTSPSMTVTNPATQISLGGIVGTPVAQTGSGGIETTLCFMGLSEIAQENLINIYPNPFSAQTTLQADKFFINASVTVYNSVGQTVKRMDNLAGQAIILHRDNLLSGLYFIRITQDNKTISADKLVIVD